MRKFNLRLQAPETAAQVFVLFFCTPLNFTICIITGPGILFLSTGVFESKLMELTDPEARKAYLDETKCTSVLDKIIVQVKGSRK